MYGTLASYGLGVVTAALQARLLGPAGRGEIAVALVPGTVLTMLLCFGLPDFFSREAARGTPTRTLSRCALQLALVIGGLTVPAYIMLAQLQADKGTTAWKLLVLLALLTPFYVYGYCVTALAIGTGAWKLSAAVRLLPNLISVLGLILLYLASGTALMVGVLLISAGLMGNLAPLAVKKFRPGGRGDRTVRRAAVRFGLKGWPAGALALLSQRIDLVLLTVIATRSEIGYYAISVTVASLLSAISNSTAMPTRNLVAQGHRKIVPGRCAATMAATLLAGLVLLALLPFVVRIVLGAEFLPALPIMAILIVAQVPLAGVIVLTQTLIGAGHPSKPLAAVAMSFAACATITLLAYPYVGEVSGAAGSLAGASLSLAILITASQKFVGRSPITDYLIPSRTSIFRGKARDE